MRLSVRVAAVVIACMVAGSSVVSAAFAVEIAGPVPTKSTVNGHDLKDLDPAQARALIASVTPLPDGPRLHFTVGGRSFRLAPSTVVAVDVERMLAFAYDTTATDGFEVPPAYLIRSAAVADWVARVAVTTYVAPTDARYVRRGDRLGVERSQWGRALDRSAARATVRGTVLAALAVSGDTTSAPVALKTVRVAPRVPVAKLGRILLVDISKRRLWLFRDGSLERTYRVAVGTRAHPTPTGVFTIVRKVKNPSWGNPAPNGWGANMPAYIPPGPNNPLGTRALYLNTSGIRIHGTSKRSSIGTAASHGCMRMLREDVEALYPLVPVGTKIHIVP